MSEAARALLLALGDHLRDEVLAHRTEHGVGGLSEVVGAVEADVIYAVDRVGEAGVRAWLDAHWPADEPVLLVMEGIEDDELVVVPHGTPPGALRWILVVDPVDGTRNLMYDKRSAWALTALAPVPVPDPGLAPVRPTARLSDLTVAVMTELPTSRQWRADQVSAVRGAGADGVRAEALDVRTGERTVLALRPSSADHVEHGFASFSQYLPDGGSLIAAIEQDVWDRLVPPGDGPRQIFEDQYICSAGQLYEVLSGRDRLVVDIRPLALAQLGCPTALTAHPYDVCTALILTEAGVIVEDPSGGPLDAPLDTTTPVSWAAYANEDLAATVRPVLQAVLHERVPDALGLPHR